MVAQPKSRSLDTAAKQIRLAVDGKQLPRIDVEHRSDGVSVTSGMGDRHSLKQLAVNKASHFSC